MQKYKKSKRRLTTGDIVRALRTEQKPKPLDPGVKLEGYRYTDDIRGYKQAVWDYFMEHCDITPNGSYFIKFHTDNQRNFENHIIGRWKHNYHRDDPRVMNEKGQTLQEKVKSEKIELKEKHKLNKKDRQPDSFRQKLRSFLHRIVNKL